MFQRSCENQALHWPRDGEGSGDAATWTIMIEDTQAARMSSWEGQACQRAKQEIEERLVRGIGRLGLMLEYSLWCAVHFGHPELNRKQQQSKREADEIR